MVDARGTVVAEDGDHAIVRVDEAGCGRCHEPGGCGGNNLGSLLCSTPRTFRVRNPRRAVVGEKVVVSIAEGAVRRGALLAYGLPLLAVLLGAVGGALLGDETGSIVGAFGGLGGAWVYLRRARIGSQAEPFIR